MNNSTILGTAPDGTEHSLSDTDQGQHIHISGATGTGKSVLMANLMASQLRTDAGICLIDPHGTLAETVLTLIPPHRHRQVVFLNMADLDRPIGLSFMSDIPPERRYKVAEDIVATFVHIFGHDAVGDRSQWVLRNAVRAVMDDGGTLLSVPKFLTNKRYRRKVLKAVLDDQVRAVWEEVFANYTSGKEDDVISPILNKLDALLVPPLRNIIGQPQATIDLRLMMDEGRILVVSLQKGMIGELPAKFLGALLVAHIANTAFSRADILADGEVPRPFFLYADEFHNFVSGDFETILAETRKYGLFFRLANQYAQQINHRLHEGILTNCDTKIAFRCSPENAEALAPIFGLHKAVLVNDHEGTPYCTEWGIHDVRTLTETPRYHAWVRSISNGTMNPPIVLRMAPPVPPANHTPKSLVQDSRVRFGRDRASVENAINQFLRSHGKPKRTKHATSWNP